jgi:hypothetical protein
MAPGCKLVAAFKVRFWWVQLSRQLARAGFGSGLLSTGDQAAPQGPAGYFRYLWGSSPVRTRAGSAAAHTRPERSTRAKEITFSNIAKHLLSELWGGLRCGAGARPSIDLLDSAAGY